MVISWSSVGLADNDDDGHSHMVWAYTRVSGGGGGCGEHTATARYLHCCGPVLIIMTKFTLFTFYFPSLGFVQSVRGGNYW